MADQENLQPGVTVGLPVYNGENYLEHAIRAVLAQTYADFELIVSDNASTDRSSEIARSFAAEDRRVRYVRRSSNVGGPANFNGLVPMATRRYFKWAAHDDLLAPEFLARCVAVLDADPEVVLCFTGITIVDDHGAPQRLLSESLPGAESDEPSKRFRELLRRRHGGFHLWGVMRTDVLATTHLHAPYPGGDRTVLSEMALRGRFVTLPDPLFMLRDHAGRSVKRLPSIYRRTSWHDPRGGRQTMPHWRIAGGYVRAIRTTPLSRRQQLGSVAALGQWTLVNWNWLRLLSDIVVRFQWRFVGVYERGSSWQRRRARRRARRDARVTRAAQDGGWTRRQPGEEDR